MEHTDPDDPDFDDLLAFTPAPLKRRRANGWTPERQRRFVLALSVMGAVGPALRAVGMGRASAYRLRERAGAESFAEAWDIAFEIGEDRQFKAALDVAMNGVTTVRVVRGGMVDVSHGPYRKLLHASLGTNNGSFLRANAATARVKATRETP